MPLIKSKSDKARNKNIETEMKANPGKANRDQNLAIAYSVQRQAKKKKMAYGGKAEDDREPAMPKAKPDDSRPDKNEIMSGQAQMLAEGGTVTNHSAPAPSQLTIESEDLNSRAKRHGMTHAQMAEHLEHEAEKHRMCMYDGGMVDGSAEETQEPSMPHAKADNMRPSADEFMADHFAKGGVAQAIMRKKKYADGGMVDEDSRPDHTQIGFDAIKKEKYADGGMVDLDEESEEHPNHYDDLNRDAANAEQYDDEQLSKQPMDSNEKGHPEEDEHDKSITAAIRRKMASKRKD